MQIAIINYGSGNLRSAAKAFEYAANEYHINARITISNNPDQIRKADKIVLPGVGAFADCKNGIRAVNELWETIDDITQKQQKPFMGICVGMQLMATKGEEFGIHSGFNWIKGTVIKLKNQNKNLKIPHMGWNTLTFPNNHPILKDIYEQKKDQHAYFVHSYHFVPEKQQYIRALTNYQQNITAIIAKNTMIGTQFHPEKSQQLGLTLIRNFLRWNP